MDAGSRATPGEGFLTTLVRLGLVWAAVAVIFRSCAGCLGIPPQHLGYLAAALPAGILVSWCLLLRPRLGLALVVFLAVAAGSWMFRPGGPAGREWLAGVCGNVIAWWWGLTPLLDPGVWSMAAGLAVLPVCLAVTALTLKRRPLWLVPPAAALFGGQWLYYYDGAPADFAAFLVPVLLLAALAHLEQLPGAGRPGLLRTAAATLALLAVAAMTAGLLPNHFEPLSLGRTADWFLDTFPFLQDLRGYGEGGWGFGRSDFSIARSGFGTSAAYLGGPIRPDETVALEITVANPPPVPTLYLKGAAKDIYTGRGWVQGARTTVDLPSPARLAFAYPPATAGWEVSLSVRDWLRAGAIFAPLQPVEVRPSGFSLRQDALGNLTPAGRPPAPLTYQVSARVPFLDPPALGPTPAGAETYLQLPDRLPQRVINLARAITGQAGDDLAKALAVQEYLRRIPYHRETPPTPRGRDFADYFLYDLRRGYCTYHSTAMVVMLRAVGVPARWVQGFAVPMPAPAGMDEPLTLVVTNSQAHAWVEVMLPGLGWFTFEPTPSLPAPAISLPNDLRVPAPVAPGTLDRGGSPGTPEGLMGDPLEDFLAFEPGAWWSEAPAAGGLPLPRVLLALGGGCLLLVVCLGAAVRGWRLWRLERPCPGFPRAAVEGAYRGACHYLALAGVGPLCHETPGEYLARVDLTFDDVGEPLTVLTRACEAARYAPAAPTAADTHQARLASCLVRRQVTAQLGWAAIAWRLLTGPAPPPLPAVD